MTRLAEMAAIVKPRVIFIDTLGSATAVPMAKQEEAQRFFRPLAGMAVRGDCAVIVNTHLNKEGGLLNKRPGQYARVVIKMTAPDDTQPDRRRLAVVKSNAKKPPALGATMLDGRMEFDDAPPECVNDGSMPAGQGEAPRDDAADHGGRGRLLRRGRTGGVARGGRQADPRYALAVLPGLRQKRRAAQNPRRGAGRACDLSAAE